VRTPLAILVLTLLLSGCPSDGAGPTDTAATALAIVVQPSAVARSGIALTQQPVVQLRNAQGAPVSQAGVLVTPVITVGGGTLGGTPGVRTDAEGKATWTDLSISGLAGERTLRFEAPGLTAVVAVPVALGAGDATTLTPIAGIAQVAPAGTTPLVLPKVRAADAFGNPVPGASVTFEVSGGGGSVTGAVQLTGADGTASPAGWTLGPAVGPNALSAYLTNAPGTPLSFTATGTVGPAAALAVVEGDGQTTTIGTAVATPPGVKVTDAFGNPVSGVAVTFTVVAGGGTVTGGTAVSGATGIARVQGWTLGFALGAQTLSASRPGITAVTVTATGTGFAVGSFSTGSLASCAVDLAGKPWCWGGNAGGQLGDGTVTPRELITAVAGGLGLTRISAGSLHACGLTAAGQAWCWGSNAFGQLGDGTKIDRLAPVQVQGGHQFTEVAAALGHTCGLRTDGLAFCWGAGNNGRLGDGTTIERLVPTQVLGGPFTSISASGSSHTCALQADATAWCWGSNVSGRLGDGTQTDRLVPVQVIDGHLWQAVVAGNGHTCGITTAGAGFCWGTGGQGQLGTGSVSNQSIPVPVAGGLVLAAVSTGATHTCAVTAAGAAYCWGFNGSGRLGDGTTNQQLQPVAVLGGLVFQAVAAGGEHTCARTTAGTALCWGRNAEGQLGDGGTTARLSPVAVKPLTP